MGFGAYIRQKREAKGFALNDFSRQLDISSAYWSRIERDMEKPPKDELISKALAILGESADVGFVEADRLPPDMRPQLGEIVQHFRVCMNGVPAHVEGAPEQKGSELAGAAGGEHLSALDIVLNRAEKGFEVLASVLREQILNGQIKPGELLPNEREIVERSGLSRGSVREALRVLETQGLVSTRLGRNGGRVALQTGSEAIQSTLDFFIRGQKFPFPVLMETVKVLEPSLAELAATHRDEADMLALRNEGKKLRAAATPKRFLTANARWHRAMAHASHNAILIAIYEALGPSLLDPHIADFASAGIRSAVVVAVGRIEEAIIGGDAAAARRRMDRHVLAYRAQLERLVMPA